MSTTIARKQDQSIALAGIREEPLSHAIEAALAMNDLSKLNVDERVQWYNHRCRIAGLEPATRPFVYIQLSGKLTLYATKECGELLNGKHGISHEILKRETVEGVHIVTIKATTASGRQTEDIGAIPVQGLKGGELANALMKTITKAKRRATLSLCGLGDVLDVSELDTVDAQLRGLEGQPIPPANGSGYGRGQYASPEQTEIYLGSMRGYLAKRNAAWLDWCQRIAGGNDLHSLGVKDLCNEWHADNHLVKWAKETGRLDPTSCDDKGVKAAQVGRYTAIIYHRSKEDRKALAKELERFLDQQAERAAESLKTKHPELFPDAGEHEKSEDEILDEIAQAEGKGDAWEGNES